MPYLFYRFYSRHLVKINLFLGVLYLLTFMLLHSELTLYPAKKTYVQTTTGFLFEIPTTTYPTNNQPPIIELD